MQCQPPCPYHTPWCFMGQKNGLRSGESSERWSDEEEDEKEKAEMRDVKRNERTG